jgi:DNA ligase-1
VAELSGRLDKVERLAALLSGLAADEVPLAVAYLSGTTPQGRIGIGFSLLRDALDATGGSDRELADAVGWRAGDLPFVPRSEEAPSQSEARGRRGGRGRRRDRRSPDPSVLELPFEGWGEPRPDAGAEGPRSTDPAARAEGPRSPDPAASAAGLRSTDPARAEGPRSTDPAARAEGPRSPDPAASADAPPPSDAAARSVPAVSAPLTLLDVHETLGRMATLTGGGSRARRLSALTELFARATPPERDFLVRLLLGELRQGALESIVLEAVARASGVEPARIRRAVMLRGEAGTVGRSAMANGDASLGGEAIQLFRPIKPMLASTADGVEDALARLGSAIFEYKFDGGRLQVHKSGDQVRIFTRRLNEETEPLPEVVEAVRALPARSLVLDGEAIALLPDGKPRPFQETMRRFGRKRDVASLREEIPLTPFFFDLLLLDDQPLIDHPAAERLAQLDALVPARARAPRLTTTDPEEARRFLRAALDAGHEGLMAKDPAAPYVAGRRGRAWLKIKSARTADLVVLAAEWGHGRRRGWLSNLHLGARGAAPGEFVMVGKTFKGMTDELLEWQTERLPRIAVGTVPGGVLLRPELVVEIQYDGVQVSPRYPGGIALRFARVKGYRPDTTPEEADTLESLRGSLSGES